MKRFTFLLAWFVFAGLSLLQAQTVQISGTVTGAEDKLPVPGVSVVVKGTTVGAVTDMDGKYTLKVPATAKTLVFSYVGMKTKEAAINGQSEINVVLESSATTLNEVVVTAIGIKRAEKSLGYSATQVNSDEITKGGDRSMVNSLQGKVAGVSISSASGAPGASTKVILRGYSSIGTSNSPLYVIDGIPIDNGETPVNSQSISGGTTSRAVDFGNRANDINPNDIATMTILKGAAATALYGSRAANGIIMITTKSGSLKQKMKVDVSTGLTLSEPLRIMQMQNEFGTGWNGIDDQTQNGSWGPKFDGKLRAWGNIVDNTQLYKPYVALKNNVKDFFETGKSYDNNIAISGGTDRTTYYLSYNNTNDNGIIPGNKDEYKRNAFTLKGSNKGDKLTSTASINYINKKGRAVTTGQGGADGATMWENLLQIPRDLSLVDMKDYNNKFYNIDNFFTPYATNPYYALNENSNDYNEDRVIGNLNLNYKFNDWLSAEYRLGGDILNSQRKDWVAIAIPSAGSWNDLRGVQKVTGSVEELAYYGREITSDFLITTSNHFTDDFAVNSAWGYNVNERYNKQEYARVKQLDIPYFYNLSNSSKSPYTSTDIYQKRLYGVYGQVDMSYKDFLFLTVTGRNDWSSTLPKNKNSFFYPGLNAGFVFSDVLPDALKNIISYGKLRGSWGKTGNDAPPYSVYSVFPQTSLRLDYGYLNFPLSGVNAFSIGNQMGNSGLKPEISSEWEAGAEMKFFNNRLGIDFTYYDKTTNNQIYAVPIPPSSGYTSQVMNFGKIQNKGIELLVTVTPVKTSDFGWDLSLNFSNNRNKVLSLTSGLDKIVLANAYDVDFVAVKGQPMGVFQGPVPMTDDQGHVVVDSKGFPKSAADKGIYGNAQAKYLMGITNQLKYKNFGLSCTFDIRQGGLIYSGTAELSYFVGNTTQSTYNDRQPFIVPNSVVDDGTGHYIANTTPIDMSKTTDYYYHTSNLTIERNLVLDRSYVKLREVVFTYDLPQSLIKKLPVIKGLTLGIVGKNLLLWTPKSNNFIDPETTTYGNDLAGDFGEFRGLPSVRSYGANLRVTF
ncbi:MAG: SusC/RagA family TonB-linked outer membrane protein [Bacteroidota bacterium]|nr:SusC/RagA family TonB-linked outer membrane protein [Bacteroidota bacterium]MDP4274816.1 SusC/RagA family TonB-linked outer membrane protein [Bacteroidota bacterium]